MSFWGKFGQVASIAAPFALAPFTGGTSMLAKLGRAGVHAGTALAGSALSGGAGGVPNVKALLESQRQSIEEGRGLASSLQPQAGSLLSGATESFSPVANYFASLLSGNRAQAMSALSPEVQRINEGFDSTTETAANLMPRGGGRSAFFSGLPYKRAGAVTNLLNTSRATAAPGLIQTGQAQGAQASSLYQTILNALMGSTSGTSSLLSYDLGERKFQYEKAKEVGGSLLDALGPLIGLKKPIAT